MHERSEPIERNEYPREGYLQYLPPELHKETQKFRRGNVPKCEPLLTVDSVAFVFEDVRISGSARTQYGGYIRYSFHVREIDLPLLAREIKEMDRGGPGPIVFRRHAAPHLQDHIARLPPSVGVWKDNPGPDIYLYCHELIDAILEAMDMLGGT